MTDQYRSENQRSIEHIRDSLATAPLQHSQL